MKYTETILFDGISKEDSQMMLTCMDAYQKSFCAEGSIYLYDSNLNSVGILLEGRASLVRYEYNGSRTILESLVPGSIFGESLDFKYQAGVCIEVVGDTDCQVLFLNYTGMTQSCYKACPCHTRLIRNVLNLLSEKSRLLSERVEVLSQRSTRDKLMCYFMQISSKKKGNSFELPFTMIDFADFLSVNRSAMVREIGKMRAEGLIEIHKKNITLLS